MVVAAATGSAADFHPSLPLSSASGTLDSNGVEPLHRRLRRVGFGAPGPLRRAVAARPGSPRTFSEAPAAHHSFRPCSLDSARSRGLALRPATELLGACHFSQWRNDRSVALRLRHPLSA